MAIQLGSAYGKVSIDSSGVQGGVNNAVKSLGTLEQAAQKIGGAMQSVGNAMTIGLTIPITALLTSSVNSAMQAESALAELNAVLASTGGAAGLTSEELTKMASELQKVTKFSDEQIILGESMLLTFTKIGKDVFPMATEAMLNMAEKFGSVENASIQLGKALNDPVAGVSALRRVGVMLTDEQEKQIKSFMEVNDIASAQKVILQELEVEFGGLARAAGDTAAGKFEQFKNTLDDFKEVLGNAIIPSLIRFMDALTPIIIAISEAPPWVIDLLVAFLGFVAASGPILSFFGGLIKVIGAFGAGGSLSGVATFFTSTLLPAFSSFFTFITATAIPAIVAFVVANSWWIVPLLLVAATVYLVYLAFKNNFMGITDTAKQLWFILKTGFSQLWPWLKKSTDEGLADIKKSFSDISIAFYDFVEAIRKNGYAFTAVYEDGSGALLDLATAFGLPEKAAQDFLSALWLVFSPMSDAKLLFEDGSGALHNLAVAFGFPTQAAQDFLSALWLVFSSMSDARLLFEDGSGALLNLAVAFGIPEKKAQEFLSHVFFVASGFIKLFKGDMLGAVQDFAVGLFDITNPQLENLIQRFMDAVSRIIENFRNVDWAAVGMNIINTIANGIMNAIPNLIAAALNAAQAAWDAAQSVFSGSSASSAASPSSASPNDIAKSMVKPSSVNSSQKQTINMQFGDGLTMRHVQEMIAVNEEMLLKRLNSVLGGI